jgi:hypothetical protein
MAFQSITNEEIQQGLPIDANLLGKVKNNDDALNDVDITIQQQLIGLLNRTDDALVGETKYLIDTIAPRGYIPANGVSIGKTSGTYTGNDYLLLYQKLWSKALATAGQPYVVSAAKGATAQVDWDAGKTITIDESGLFTRASGGNAGTVGSKQTDDFKSHTHTVTPVNFGISGSSGGLAGTAANTAATTTVRSVDNIGGTETRPVNVAKYVFIRYSNKVIL